MIVPARIGLSDWSGRLGWCGREARVALSSGGLPGNSRPAYSTPMPTSPPKRRGWLGWTLAALALLICAAYVGAYLRVVEPTARAWTDLHGAPIEAILPDYSGATPFEPPKRDQKFWKRVFAPAHWLDRRIRRDKWTP